MLAEMMDRDPSATRRCVTGFILAGGASRRMGRDKAQIPWSAGTLLTHAIEQLKRVTDDIYVVGQVQTNNISVTVLPDTKSGIGPMAGIHTALSHVTTDWNLVLAVDLPLLSTEVLKFLTDVETRASDVAIVPRVNSRLQPLSALYHRDFFSEVERALEKQESSIHRLLERVNTRIIEEELLIANGFSPEMFLNVNTPEDLKRARALARAMHV